MSQIEISATMQAAELDYGKGPSLVRKAIDPMTKLPFTLGTLKGTAYVTSNEISMGETSRLTIELRMIVDEPENPTLRELLVEFLGMKDQQ